MLQASRLQHVRAILSVPQTSLAKQQQVTKFDAPWNSAYLYLVIVVETGPTNTQQRSSI
jgi:hypothetical protein